MHGIQNAIRRSYPTGLSRNLGLLSTALALVVFDQLDGLSALDGHEPLALANGALEPKMRESQPAYFRTIFLVVLTFFLKIGLVWPP